MDLINSLSHEILFQIGDFFAQVPTPMPLPIPLPMPSPAASPTPGVEQPDWLRILDTVAKFFPGLIISILLIRTGYLYVKKARAEPGALESATEQNRANAQKLQVEVTKLEAERKKLEAEEQKIQIETIEKRLSIGEKLSKEDSEYLTLYREYVDKQSDYMKSLQEYADLQREYIKNFVKPTSDLIARVQMFLLRFIALFLVLQFANIFQTIFNYLIDLLVLLSQLSLIGYFPGVNQLLRIFNFIPSLVYISVVLLWGFPLFEEVNEIVKFNFEDLNVSTNSVFSDSFNIFNKFTPMVKAFIGNILLKEIKIGGKEKK